MDKSVLAFLLPQWDGTPYGGLQVVFAVVFLAVVIVTPLLLARSARASQWERRLGMLAGPGGALPAQTTPEELSEAVATGAERWAAVLPGLLLIAGLLGSFIGLGLALSDTAGVLGGPQAPGALGAVIDALGAKFKISTWGILAFLLLKIWFTLGAHEQARLAWSTLTLRRLQEQAGARQAQQQADQQQRLIDAIRETGNALLVAQQAEAQRAHLRHAELLDALQRQSARQD